MNNEPILIVGTGALATLFAARLAERTPTAEAQLRAFGNPTISPDVADPLPGAER